MEFEDTAILQIKEEVSDIHEEKPDFVQIVNYDIRQLSQDVELPDVKQENEIDTYEHIREVRDDRMDKQWYVADTKDVMNGSPVPQVVYSSKTQVICLECGKLFADRGSYKLHPCGECPFRCDQCGKSYKKSTELSFHMKIHTALEKRSISSSASTLGKKGKVINSQAREIIANVMAFMRAEAERGSHMIPISHFKARVIAATRISEGSYRNIAKESARIESGEMTSYSSPGKKRARTTIAGSLSMAEKERIRRIVHNFYIVDKKRPSLKGIYRKLQESGHSFKGGASSLRTVLLKLGFRWRKAEDKGKILFDSYDIRLKRIEYLRTLSNFRKEGRPIIYLDETYVFSSHTYPVKESKSKKPITRGNRLIIMHAGGEMGSVENVLHTSIGRKYGNYHDDITEEYFFNWVNKRLIPNLPAQSVVVLDNAPYHNVRLEKEVTSDTPKKDMTDWLAGQNIPFDPSWTKVELFNLIKTHKQECSYKLDVLLDEHGHSILRLPPYHSELSAIEQIWASMKEWVGAHNKTFALKDVENLVRKKFDEVSVAEWGSVCEHVKQLEEEYIQREHLLEQANDEQNFIVNAMSCDESDSDMESDFNSDME